MLSVTHLLCDHHSGNEALVDGHASRAQTHESADSFDHAPRPVVVWAVTRACNLRCVHCHASAAGHPSPHELTYDEGTSLLDDLRAFDVPAVLFSGGEPLSRPDCPELISYAHNIGLRCTLSTNGLLIDDAMADRLSEIGLRHVGISLDGSQPVHDKLRGMTGAFDGALAAIDRCKARGMKVGVRFTVHALNQDDLDAIFGICLSHKVDRLCVYHLACSGRAGNMRKIDLTGDETRNVLDRIFDFAQVAHGFGHPLEVLTVGNHADAAYLLLHLEQTDPIRLAWVEQCLKGTGGNRSGCNIAAIDPTGTVHYDQFSWNYPCGNIRQVPFSHIWSTASDQRLWILRNRTAYLPDRCRACRFLDVCNGNLRTRAEVATGNWLGEDPSCYLAWEERQA